MGTVLSSYIFLWTWGLSSPDFFVASLAGGVGAHGTVGTLAGFGFSDERAKEYEDEIKAGKILIAVKTSEDKSN